MTFRREANVLIGLRNRRTQLTGVKRLTLQDIKVTVEQDGEKLFAKSIVVEYLVKIIPRLVLLKMRRRMSVVL